MISELPPSSTALAASICKKITGRLTSAIAKVMSDDYIIERNVYTFPLCGFMDNNKTISPPLKECFCK